MVDSGPLVSDGAGPLSTARENRRTQRGRPPRAHDAVRYNRRHRAPGAIVTGAWYRLVTQRGRGRFDPGGVMARTPRSILFVVAFALSASATAADQFVNVLTGGTSGVYYPLGVALANVIGKAMPAVKTSVQATKASVENLNLLQAGRGEIAFTLGDSLSDAWKGNEEAGFKTPLKKLRGIAAIYPNYIQIVARADAGIKTLADLKGKQHLGRRAQVGHRAQRADDPRGRRNHLQGLREGRIPAVRRIASSS